MRSLKQLAILLSIAFLQACSNCMNNEELFENRGLIVRSFSLPDCVSRGHKLPDELVITNDSAFAFYFPESINCDLGVDLSEQALLRYPSTGTCNVMVIREVTTKERGSYLYRKTVKECGDCALSAYDEGWVLVDIPEKAPVVSFSTVRE